ncbi:MAG: DNA primase [Planctomycetes bacterium]|nr:DNA primase [Planctomycetota bacterium]MCW8134680.1 DNA primase [Planctomycetota bacterium]
MGRIARDSIEEVRRSNDIVEVIAGYLPLQKRGGAFWACCPFHDEKTPSFNAHPVRQTYKCFGCGEFGSVIDFVMKHEKLDFIETIEKLAARANITLRYESGGPTQAERSLRARALDMMLWAQRGFVANLERHQPARQYLESRGLGGEVAARWGIGYAPDEFTRQSDAALKRFDVQTIEATGLCKRGDRGWYDFFRGRVTFPIRDAQARIVGFGARLLDPEAKAQKYLNSAEGLLFHKSKLLYGIDLLAQSQMLKKTGRVLIMEGYTDVIAAHEAGFDNAVAPLGTALTLEQLGLLRRYGAGVTLVLDGDDAGLAAAERGVNVCLEAGVDARVAVVRGAKDPFDLIRNGGPAALQAVLDASRDAFEFKLDGVRARHDFTRPVEAEAALKELAETVGRAESDSLRELYGRKAANALGLREGAVLQAIGEARQRYTRQSQKAEKSDKPPQAAPTDARQAYEREVLRQLFECPRALSMAAEIVYPGAFSTAGLQALYREMLNAWDEHRELVPGALLAELSAEGRAELERVLEQLALPENQSSNPEREAALLKELKNLAEHAQTQAKGAHSLEELRQKRGKKARKQA